MVSCDLHGRGEDGKMNESGEGIPLEFASSCGPVFVCLLFLQTLVVTLLNEFWDHSTTLVGA